MYQDPLSFIAAHRAYEDVVWVDEESFNFTGSWHAVSGVGDKDDLKWAYTATTRSNVARYDWTPSATGNHEVWAFVPWNHGTSTRAPIRVINASSLAHLMSADINQSNRNDAWVKVGSALLSAGTTYRIDVATDTRESSRKVAVDDFLIIRTDTQGGDCIGSVPSDRWKGEYFNNRSLSGTPSMVRDDGAGALNFDWGTGSPSTSCGIGADNFSVRWSRTASFNAGTYRFTVTSDDGFRLYVDGSLKLNKWIDQAPTTYTIDVPLSAGNHTIRMDYYENGGGAVAKLSWKLTSNLTGGEPKGAFGAGGQTDAVTEPGSWRFAEWFYGHRGIDQIASRTDACGAAHTYAMGWHGEDLAEYLMKFGGDYDQLVLRGIADRPGPVNLAIYIDGQYRATASWNNNNDCNQDVTVKITGISYGTHAIAVKFTNDYYDPTANADRNLYLDALVVRQSANGCSASVPSTSWKAEYFNNRYLSGSPSMVRNDGTAFLNFDWGGGSPGSSCGIGADNFSARWTRTVYFNAGTYRFTVTSDDGFRLYVDGSLKLNKWFDQAPTTYTADVPLSIGNHAIKMEYYENGGGAVAKLSWHTVSQQADLKVSGISFTSTPTAGVRTTAVAQLANVGGSASGVFNVKWYLDEVQVGYGGHASLAPGQVSNGNVRFDWTPSPGTHTLRFVADADNHVTEADENNNSYVIWLLVN
jgi:hypothetical protein